MCVCYFMCISLCMCVYMCVYLCISVYISVYGTRYMLYKPVSRGLYNDRVIRLYMYVRHIIILVCMLSVPVSRATSDSSWVTLSSARRCSAKEGGVRVGVCVWGGVGVGAGVGVGVGAFACVGVGAGAPLSHSVLCRARFPTLRRSKLPCISLPCASYMLPCVSVPGISPCPSPPSLPSRPHLHLLWGGGLHLQQQFLAH
ncbi:hypothetical protein B484DRAFT_171401 [Ochromonadaceae sp. CCMP2298]|nr:hypothetical protein B484DRAFT_171401 [Ochromonadaceae sp. CCMP2298]